MLLDGLRRCAGAPPQQGHAQARKECEKTPLPAIIQFAYHFRTPKACITPLDTLKEVISRLSETPFLILEQEPYHERFRLGTSSRMMSDLNSVTRKGLKLPWAKHCQNSRVNAFPDWTGS